MVKRSALVFRHFAQGDILIPVEVIVLFYIYFTLLDFVVQADLLIDQVAESSPTTDIKPPTSRTVVLCRILLFLPILDWIVT